MKTIDITAMKYKGRIYQGRRHSDCIRAAHALTGDKPIIGIQGFLDSENNFLTRKAAAIVALKNGQIKKIKYSKTELYSEDLY